MEKRIPTLNDFIYESYIIDFVNEMASPKDLKRINDLIAKANGNEAKEVALATQMVNTIKDKQKALQRYQAALDILGKEHPVTGVFADKAISLGHKIDKDAEPKKKDTRGKLGSEDSKLKAMGRDYKESRYNRPPGSPILPIGSTNLASGKCKYFNIYETWGDGNDTTIEVWAVDLGRFSEVTSKYRFVITAGDGPIYKIGTRAPFIHDQTGNHIFSGELVDWANIGDADLIMKKYNLKSALGYVYK